MTIDTTTPICAICRAFVYEDEDAISSEIGFAHCECYNEARRNDENDDYDNTAFWHDISHER